MLGFDDLTPEQMKALASKSPEIAAVLAEQEAEKQRAIDSIMTPEKFEARVDELNRRVWEVLNHEPKLKGEELVNALVEAYSYEDL